jgi:hypothetical protein
MTSHSMPPIKMRNETNGDLVRHYLKYDLAVPVTVDRLSELWRDNLRLRATIEKAGEASFRALNIDWHC